MSNENGRSMRLLIVVGVVGMLVITSLIGGFFVYRAIENDASNICKKQVKEFTDRMSPAIELYLSATRLMEKTTLEKGVLKSTDQWLVAYAQTVQADEIVKGIVPTTCATDTINAQLYVLSAITLFRERIDEALYARSKT